MGHGEGGREARALIFFDTETTGTDPQWHSAWELAALRREPDGSVSEFYAQLRLSEDQIRRADPKALEVGGFHERYRAADARDPDEVIAEFCEFAAGAVLAALNVSFDIAFLRPALTRAGVAPSWHYSPLELKSFAAGALGLAPPWRSDEIAPALGIDPSNYARHSALADCWYSAAIYDAALALHTVVVNS